MNLAGDEIRAELLLSYLYPGKDDFWMVVDEGSFYRNYNADVISVDSESGELRLSRDGALKLLPDTMISPVDELKGASFKDKYDSLELRMKRLNDACLPFDTVAFRRSLAMEHKVSELLGGKLEHILFKYFDFDLNAEQDPLVRQAAMFLPAVSRLRGDFNFIRLMLVSILDCSVTLDTSHRAGNNTSEAWLPEVKYILDMPGLTAMEYCSRMKSIAPLERFLSEWFIPCEVVLKLAIKDVNGPAYRTGAGTVLDYNGITEN